MRIVTARRITQVFFLLLFVWFVVVATVGERFHQLRGWPVNWLLELDPLVAVSTMLSTHTLYKGLLWALLTVLLTIVLGRFFCGWVCPFGTMHHFFGWIALRSEKVKARMEANRYRRAHRIKYYILIVFLVMAVFGSVQSGLLDPIPLIHRTGNLVLLPITDAFGITSAAPRQYDGAWVIGAIFVAALLLNFVIPRFYCRILCPAGALFGLLSRHSLFRIARRKDGCTGCTLCAVACEGAADPDDKVRMTECLMCMNCLDESCKKDRMTYGLKESDVGEGPAPDLGRRGVLLALGASVLAVPAVRLSGTLAGNYHPGTIRPPASLPEAEFLERCIKCGQCMRVCPSNCIAPAGLNHGFESLWTPVLNFRIGSSGCQLNCTACGHICPTAAIRPISLEEKVGAGRFEARGPIRMGTAFVDRGRCLPWAMNTPCIVCEENCPVTPKAIYVKEFFEDVRGGTYTVGSVEGEQLTLNNAPGMRPGQFATGDYYVRTGEGRHRIAANTAEEITLERAPEASIESGQAVRVQVRLQAPVVDISRCIGCGICEHECPVSGLRAIRVTAENESRNIRNSLLLKRT
jgi:polyferredoxin